MNIAILTQEKYSGIAWHFPIVGCQIYFDHTNEEAEENEFLWEDHDLVISLLYDKIVKNNEFDLPKLGTINIHPSLLPHHRGSCPNFWAVLDGTGAGWTAHRMTSEIDHGDIYLQHEMKVLLSDTAETLWDRLFEVLPQFLFELAELITNGNLVPLDIVQDNDKVNTLKKFHSAHNFNSLIEEMNPLQQIASYATLTMIQACSFSDYEGFVLDTPDGRVEFKASRLNG